MYVYIFLYPSPMWKIPTRKHTCPPDHWPLCHCAEMSIKPLFIFINDNLEVNSCSRTGSHVGPLPGIPGVPSAFPPVCPAPRAAFPNSFAMGNQPMRHQFKHVCPKEEKKKRKEIHIKINRDAFMPFWHFQLILNQYSGNISKKWPKIKMCG